jgi:hypothetical protein
MLSIVTYLARAKNLVGAAAAQTRLVTAATMIERMSRDPSLLTPMLQQSIVTIMNWLPSQDQFLVDVILSEMSSGH